MTKDFYEDSFNDELPKLKSQQDKEAVRAAVLRFIHEIRKEIVNISTTNGNKAITGELQVDCEPKVVIKENQNRKTVYLKNVGKITCKIYGINEASSGSYPLEPDKEIMIQGANAIAISTVSGVGMVSFLDT